MGSSGLLVIPECKDTRPHTGHGVLRGGFEELVHPVANGSGQSRLGGCLLAVNPYHEEEEGGDGGLVRLRGVLG